MLKVSDLHIKFHSRDREAVGGISFEVKAGEILGLVGESGSGKTVTAMAIGGLLDKNICDYSGAILFAGKDLLHLGGREMNQIRGKELGVVFQEPMSALDPLMKVGKQAEEVLKLHTSLSKAERRAEVLKAFEAVDLKNPEEVYASYPHELSGGMLQRAMIAAVTVVRPKLILLDEPTTALDVTVQAGILELLKKRNEEMGISMLFISHDLNVVKKICKRVAVMQRGAIVETGETDKVFSDPQHEYTKRLVNAVPHR